MKKTAQDRTADLDQIIELVEHFGTTAAGLGFDQNDDVQIEIDMEKQVANIRRRIALAMGITS